MALLAAGAAAAATSIGMYLDAKYSIRSDVAQLRGAKKLQKHVEDMYKEHGEDDWSFYHVLHSTYAENHHTDKEAFVFEDRSWTYRQLREEIGRLAEAFESLGIRNRTVVGMFVNNSPEFLMAWWALYKIGAISAPINTAITGTHIKHCLKISEAEFCITTHELSGTLLKALLQHPDQGIEAAQALPHLRDVLLYDYNTYPAPRDTSQGAVLLKHDDLPAVTPDMADFPKSKRPKVGPTDAAQYLFTSGTTGMPKGLIWPLGYNHLSACSKRWPGMQGKRRRWYICLPMFHGTASFAALPGAMSASGTVILARRFSRREFWADIRRSQANAILYIGEMFRYLVQAPPDPRFPDEKDHAVDLAFGLGLAPGVWRAVRERFGIPWIVEYYSASEATISLVNSNKNDLGVGKVARYGAIMRSKWFGQSTFAIVRADFETGEVVRDPRTGFCIKTKPGEVGEAICKIAPPIQRKHDYIGVGGEEATDKKTLRDVFEKGDEYTRIGDALVIDEDGFISFRDRLGDTYRAKGHNISTTEVEAWLSRHPQITSVNVYAIPMNRYGYDGQLGCAAVTLQDVSADQLDRAYRDTISQLEEWLQTSESALPRYAVPRFVRVLVNDGAAPDSGALSGDSGSERVSAIMKKLKTGLRKDGFLIPEGNPDRMFWIEREGEGYVPLTPEAVQRLLSGKARL
ncbi:bifunctional fatty acid transporter/acyl-CoA synthetase [Cladophialophora carrionii]|uniref:Bifunctional fatty acid transporter/acyl-CoA synthetase n=1 Tax=Cladophialophora carrionii TaxID=86049 RepID=A0A1C1C8I1_9EURO|nr:bifunctional fatty acid transporter/acyl-CoA synthetase [Cladophialophora carrionii]